MEDHRSAGTTSLLSQRSWTSLWQKVLFSLSMVFETLSKTVWLQHTTAQKMVHEYLGFVKLIIHIVAKPFQDVSFGSGTLWEFIFITFYYSLKFGRSIHNVNYRLLHPDMSLPLFDHGAPGKEATKWGDQYKKFVEWTFCHHLWKRKKRDNKLNTPLS